MTERRREDRRSGLYYDPEGRPHLDRRKNGRRKDDCGNSLDLSGPLGTLRLRGGTLVFALTAFIVGWLIGSGWLKPW